MNIKPDKKVLRSWVDCYVPEKDLFFLSKEHLDYEFDFTDVLLMPKDEFYNHSTYRQVNYVNGYEYWNIKNVDYVIIAEKEWIETIPEGRKRSLLDAQGANYLAAVLFVISKGKQEWFIYEWVHQKTFLEKLEQYHYEELITEDLVQGDVVIWTDKSGIIQHAAYHLGEQLYFNKDGQTMFNPWKILSKKQLYREWEHLTIVKYRQCKEVF